MRKTQNSSDNLRDNLRDYLDEDELNLYQHLKTINPARLSAMLPAWIKRHNAARALPKRFVFIPNLPPVYPAWTYR